MRKYYISVVLVLSVIVFAGTTQAEKMTIDQAVERALEISPVLGIQNHSIERAMAERQTRSLLPNPTINYDREELDLAGTEGGEWILSAEMPLDFLWRRGPLLGESDALINAEKFGLQDQRQIVRYQTKQAYLEFHFGRLVLKAHQRANDILQDIERTSQALKTEGDISGYDQKRIAFEVLRSGRNLVNSANELEQAERTLYLLVFGDNLNTKIETELSSSADITELDMERLVSLALERRADIQSTRSRITASGIAIRAARRDALPGVNLGLGYKRQVDGFEGPVGRLGIELPIFDRNQGDIAGKESRLESAKLANVLLEREIKAEIIAACKSYNRLRNQLYDYRKAMPDNPESLVETARFSYMEGEISLLELIDAVRTYTENAELGYGLLRDTFLSLYRLEYLTGGNVL